MVYQYNIQTCKTLGYIQTKYVDIDFIKTIKKKPNLITHIFCNTS